ncbi:MAG: translation initiation factor IF-2 [Cellulosilyticaceae bacterium]
MSKIRVYELAKRLNISTKEIMIQLKECGCEVQSHMSSIEDQEVNLITNYYKANKKEEIQQKEEKEPKPPQSIEQNLEKEQVKEEVKELNKNQQVKKEVKKEVTKPKNANNTNTGKPAQIPNLQKKSKNNNKKKNKKQEKAGHMGQNNSYEVESQQDEELKVIEIPSMITVKNLGDKLDTSATEIIKILMKQGKLATINQEIDYDLAVQVAEEFGVLVEQEEERDLAEEIFGEVVDQEDQLVSRPPVVVVMGHVDHGKTSLLDAIRSSSVTTREAGGITQHIGAYSVTLNGEKITFLDTPGHEAFTAMRMRGAQVTDIAILVVAADDGVMPQTIEAINHARAANVQIIVAMNKMDKPGANPDRVKQELSDQGLLVEDWGGDTICVPVSALKQEGLDTLLEMILLVAEVNDYRANPSRKARGTIVEAELDKGRGPVATVLVQSGTLRIGDPIVAGCAHGRIRAMIDDKGKQVKKATPSMPVEILGLSEVPIAGDVFYVANNDKQARQVAEKVKAQGRENLIQATQKVSLDDLFTQIQEGKVKELNIVVKADVQGSVQAVRQSLERLSNEEVRIRIIHGAVGAITESDVMLASASGAIIIGFNVRPEATTRLIADREKVDVRLYRVIYNAIEDVQAAMKGMLDPEFVEKVTGHAEIRQTFKVSGVGTVGGAYVLDGKIARNAGVRIVRDGIVVYEGKLTSLKRFKDDAKEVNTGYECGVMFERFNDLREGDTVEAFIMEEIPR